MVGIYIFRNKNVEKGNNFELSSLDSNYRLHKRFVRIPASTRVCSSSFIRGSPNKTKGSPLAIPAVTIRAAEWSIDAGGAWGKKQIKQMNTYTQFLSVVNRVWFRAFFQLISHWTNIFWNLKLEIFRIEFLAFYLPKNTVSSNTHFPGIFLVHIIFIDYTLWALWSALGFVFHDTG